ncbi:GRIP domain-containing [Lecanosticta acicola]|uniref:GRIP domain-containing n=1 Tax=Lecanosticta acicola TaxID=111012 RepID=A0AAI8YZZ1_9PEZI|nr:GRIP domain-containing [Lecanosticta acicola]
MSAVNNPTDSKSAAKKKKKSKKKANGPSQQSNAALDQNGVKDSVVEDEEEDEASQSTNKGLMPPQKAEDTLHMPSSPPEPASPVERGQPVQNGSHTKESTSEADRRPDEPEDDDDEEAEPMNPSHGISADSDDTTARLNAMQEERDSLKAEVTQLRESLESFQKKHSEELSGVKDELQQTQESRDHAETQYKNLLGKVNTIRTQLGERLKADAAELETARERIEELETSNRTAGEENERLQDQMSKLNSEKESQASEIEELRNRTNLSQGNWVKERDELVRREAYMREEYEVAKQAMQDWEILATEERSRREALEERVQELEEQLNGQREAYERVRGEAETQGNTVDGLQRALRDLQEERKRELREMVEQSQSQLESLRAQTKAAEDAATDLKKELDTTQKELERAAPFEKEVKEKNLLIGKLRHEAVILNDHLTKALRFLKRGKPEDNVDRQIVTNHFLQFLQLDRSDPKKFQVLQLIAALLGWDEQQREQAGLLRQGSGFSTAGGSLRVPVSPFRRTPSTPTLTGNFDPMSPSSETGGRESLAELWSDFLEREAETGVGGHSRRPSLAQQSVRSPSLSLPQQSAGIMAPPMRSPDLKRKESASQATSAAAATGTGSGRQESRSSSAAGE